MMSTLAALRTGPGITTLAAPVSVVQGIAPQLMEAMTVSLPETPEGSVAGGAVSGIAEELERASACLIGCGLRHTRESADLVRAVLNAARGTLVLDADALNCIGENAELLHGLARPAIITPHPGEMARLCGKSVAEILEKPAETALRYASDAGCVVVLKGHRTLVASPEGELWQNTTGNAGLAKGGSGDVLAGMIAGLAAQGMPPADAAVCGVYLHGYAADRLAERMSMRSMLARDIIAELPFAVAAVENLEAE